MKSSLPPLYRKLKERGFFGKPRDRLLLNEVLEIIDRELADNVSPLMFIQLPPGYGKTAVPFSLALWSILNEETPIERSIHVLPLRAIIEDVNTRFTGYGRGIEDKLIGLRTLGISKEDAENISGAQCMFIHGSPFLQKEGFISTTLDTFALLACKLPTCETSKIARREYELYGHYEISRGAILSSIIVFDEAHLFFEEHSGTKRASQALLALVISLLERQVPVIIMTATLPYSLRKQIIEYVKEYVPKTKFNIFEYNNEGKIDQGFEDEIHSIKLKTRIERSEEEYINLIEQAYDSYDHVLVVTNTIPRSIYLFNKLESKGIRPLLLHSKFTQEDRESKLEKLKRNSRWLCISTQVIEAGVDISSDVLFTDIAPICSIIQRAGRCSRPSHICSESGEVVICVSGESLNAAKKVYDESKIENTYKELTNISEGFCWHSYLDYFPLVNKIYNENESFKLGYVFTSLQRIFENPYYESIDALEYLLELGSFTRDSLLIPAVVCEKGEIENLEDLFSKSNLFIPLEEVDLKIICKKFEVNVLSTGKDNEIEEKPLSMEMVKNIAKDIITGRIYAIRISKEVYDRERGLSYELLRFC